MLNDTQLRIYRSLRAMKGFTGIRAAQALILAREGRVRKTHWETSGDKGFIGTTPIRVWRHRDSVPFRFVGLSHEIGVVSHTGWYTRSEDPDGTLAGIVYRLPGRNGEPRYLVGYESSDSGEIVLYCDHAYSDEWDAAHMADACASGVAEREREYNDAWQAGQYASYEIREALDDLRHEVSRIVQIALYPDRIGLTIDDAASADRRHEEARDALRDAIRTARDGWPTYSQGLRDAYREGMEITRIKAINGGIEL